MSSDKPTRSIELEIEIDAPKDAAWRALTTPEELARWFPPIAGGSGAAGEKLLISWGEGMEWWTSVAKSDSDHVRWVDEPTAYVASETGNVGPLAMDWYIETRNGRTVVRLVHSGFGTSAEWDDQYNGTANGWPYFLFNLRHYLEHHRGTPRVMVSERRRSPVSRLEFWDRLTGASGLGIGVCAAGDTRQIAIGERELTAHVAHSRAPSHLWLRLPSLDDALFLAEVEGSGEGFHCGLWLSTYGLAEPRVADLRTNLRALADRVFAASP